MVKIVDNSDKIRRTEKRLSRLEDITKKIAPSNSTVRRTDFHDLVVEVTGIKGRIEVGFNIDEISGRSPSVSVNNPQLYVLASTLTEEYEKIERVTWELHKDYYESPS